MGTIRRRNTTSETVETTVNTVENTVSDVSLFGFQSEDATSFIIMLVPFILSWTIGYLGFSSFFAFLVAGGVYWTMFTKHRYIRKHTWLTELVGNCITGENTCIEEKEELYRQCKLANIPMRQIPASLMHNDQQRAEWLNIIISQMWPFISDYIKRILRETVEPSIKALLPQMKIQFTKISLGKKPPRIVAIKVYEQKDGDARDRIELDCQLAWVSDASFKLKVMASSAEIERVEFFGNMRISLEPLLSEPPLIGAISLTFLVHPDVEYQLNGLAAVANAPGVKSAVQRAVNDAIATYLVMPNRIDIPIATLETNALHFRLPEGVVRISVIQARQLHNLDSGFLLQGKSDPYARVKVGSEEQRTHVIDSDLNPVWCSKSKSVSDFTFDFPVHDLSQEITVELWDEDNDADDFLGHCKVTVSELVQESLTNSMNGHDPDEDEPPPRGYIQKWYDLTGKNISKGQVRLGLNWLRFSTHQTDYITTGDHAYNTFFIGVFLNSVNHLPNHLRGRQIYVEVKLEDHTLRKGAAGFSQSQQSHQHIGPDCSLAETKWFFIQNMEKLTLTYTIFQASNNTKIASYIFRPSDFQAVITREIDPEETSYGTTWRQKLDVQLNDDKQGKTNLKSTIAIRFLQGNDNAFERPISEPKLETKNTPRTIPRKLSDKYDEISLANTVANGSMGTLNNFSEDYNNRPELTDVHLTWRYSPNSEIVTVVVHKVNNNFPENAKIKFKCGKRFADSRHHPDINENKIEIKKCNVDSAYRIDLLVRLKRKTIGRGTIDMANDSKQHIQIFSTEN